MFRYQSIIVDLIGRCLDMSVIDELIVKYLDTCFLLMIWPGDVEIFGCGSKCWTDKWMLIGILEPRPQQIRCCHGNMWQCNFKYDEKQRKLLLYKSRMCFLLNFITQVNSHCECFYIELHLFLFLFVLCPAEYLSQLTKILLL